jgi:hypothetical protein
MQTTCGIECAISYGRKQQSKKDRVETAKRKERAKSRSDWMKEAQAAFNAYIRKRDEALPCISCGRHHTGQYHAGHYLSVGARPELRFCELNVWKQCAPCNTHLHGNLVLYRAELIRRIGIDKVEWLEGPHEPKKYRIDDLKAIKEEYKRKAREL